MIGLWLIIVERDCSTRCPEDNNGLYIKSIHMERVPCLVCNGYYSFSIWISTNWSGRDDSRRIFVQIRHMHWYQHSYEVKNKKWYLGVNRFHIYTVISIYIDNNWFVWAKRLYFGWNDIKDLYSQNQLPLSLLCIHRCMKTCANQMKLPIY